MATNWLKKYDEGGMADMEMSAPEPMAPEPAKHPTRKPVKGRRTVRRSTTVQRPVATTPNVVAKQAPVAPLVENPYFAYTAQGYPTDVEKGVQVHMQNMGKDTSATPVYAKVDYSKITDRNQIIDTAINQILGAETDPNKKKQLQTLLRMTNYMENRYGENDDAWKNKNVNYGFTELDKISIDNLFKPKGNKGTYTKGQKNAFEYLKNFGLPTDQKELEKLLLNNDPLANMAVSRLVYATNPNPLPNMNDQKAVFNYWLNDYNHRGAIKHHNEDELFKIFQEGYNKYNGPDYKSNIYVGPDGHTIVLPEEQFIPNQTITAENPIVQAKNGGWLNKYEDGTTSAQPTLTFNTMPAGTVGMPPAADNTRTTVAPIITKEEKNKRALRKLQQSTNEHVTFAGKDAQGNPIIVPAAGTTYGDNGTVVAGTLLAGPALKAAGSLMDVALPYVGNVGNALTIAAAPSAAWNAAQGDYTDAALIAAPWALSKAGEALSPFARRATLAAAKTLGTEKGLSTKQAGVLDDIQEMITNPKQYFTKEQFPREEIPSYSQEFKIVNNADNSGRHIQYKGNKIPVYGTVNTGDKNWNIVNMFTVGNDTRQPRDVMHLVSDNGEFQHFYKSSGTNSGKTLGSWYPYEGYSKNGWFIKGAAPAERRSYDIYPKTDPRYGRGSTEQYRIATILDDQYPHAPNQDIRFAAKIPFQNAEGVYHGMNYPEYYFNNRMTYGVPVPGNPLGGNIDQSLTPQYIPGLTFFNPISSPVPGPSSRVIDWNKVGKTALGVGVAGAAASTPTILQNYEGLQKHKNGGWLNKYQVAGPVMPADVLMDPKKMAQWMKDHPEATVANANKQVLKDPRIVNVDPRLIKYNPPPRVQETIDFSSSDPRSQSYVGAPATTLLMNPNQIQGEGARIIEGGNNLPILAGIAGNTAYPFIMAAAPFAAPIEGAANAYFGYEGAKAAKQAYNDFSNYDYDQGLIHSGEAALGILPALGGVSNTVREASPFVRNATFRAAKALGTEEGLLSNTYKINPIANKKPPLNKLYHKSNNPNLTLDDIDIFHVGQSQSKARFFNLPIEERPAGFYTSDEAFYPLMGGRSKYSFDFPANAKIKDLEITGRITDRISQAELKKLADEGYDLIKGKNMIGQTEYIPLNKSKMQNWKFEGTGGTRTDIPGAVDLSPFDHLLPFKNDRFVTVKPHWLQGYKEVPSKEKLIDLWRIQRKDGKTFAQLYNEGNVHPIFKNKRALDRMAEQEKYFGQWFTKDKNDFDFYISDREFKDPEVLHLQVPESKLDQYQNYDKSLSRASEREFVIPHEDQQKYLVNRYSYYPSPTTSTNTTTSTTTVPTILKNYQGLQQHKNGGWLNKYQNGDVVNVNSQTEAKDNFILTDENGNFVNDENGNPVYANSTTNYTGGDLGQATVSAKGHPYLKYKQEYETLHPKSEYINNYLNQPFAQGLGNTKDNYPERLDTEYDALANRYAAEQVFKNNPKLKKESRGRYLDRLATYIDENGKSRTSLPLQGILHQYKNDSKDTKENVWRKALEGIERLGLDFLDGRDDHLLIKHIANDKNLSTFEKNELLKQYKNNPILSTVGDVGNVISPLTIPYNATTGALYTTAEGEKGYTPFSALSGEVPANEAPMEYQLMADPLNLGFPLVEGLETGSKVSNVATRAEEIQNAGNAMQKSWQIRLPGLHLRSTMSDGAISKIVEPKTGLINVEQALKIIGKESRGADKVDLIKKGLGENIPMKMDYNEFRKIVQDQLIPLERQFSIHASNYGIDRLGYNSKPQGNIFQRFQTTFNNNPFGIAPLENRTLILSNKSKFGRGSNAHRNPAETLGHIHFLRDKETPDVLTVTQIQSDAFQSRHGRNVIPKEKINIEVFLKQIEQVENWVEREKSILEKMKTEGLNETGLPVDRYQIKEQEYKLQQAQSVLNDQLSREELQNFDQLVLLSKNHQERYLQELVNYAAERGDINKIRVPTAETADKVQGFTKRNRLNAFVENVENMFDPTMGRIREALSTPAKQETILKKYKDQPDIIKKLFGVEPEIVTDSKGNTWYEFDIPKTFKDKQGEVIAFKYGGWLNKYEDGSKVYVSSTTDPRYTRYKDSLDLYNYYELQKKLENPYGESVIDVSKDSDIGEMFGNLGHELYNRAAGLASSIHMSDEDTKNQKILFNEAAKIIKNNPNLTWGSSIKMPGSSLYEQTYEAYKKAGSPDIKTKDDSIRPSNLWTGIAANNGYANVKPHTEVVVAPPIKINQGDTYVTQYGEYEIVSDPNSGAGVKLKNKKTGQVSEVNRNDIASHIYKKDANITTPKPVQKTTPPPQVKKTTTTTAATPSTQTETTTTTTTTPTTAQKTTTTTKKTAAPFDPKRGGFYTQDGKNWRYDINGNIVPADRNTNNGMKYGGWLNKYK